MIQDHMASNILSGDRRWASGRKSGMTILGKVPKPINLPSQRSENNGLDPNVEIVPKGTLSWGSRLSSSTSNVWSSSTLLSPKTDGGTGSPSHYNSRPSSGGSGTRPSTAGSDKSLDSQNAWGSNSRPSTASGLSPSHQAPVLASRPRSAETRPIIAAHPRSAETRPGSSQLSRFAENVPEPAVAWGSTKTADKLGIASSINQEFSLRSGDFPTLGSEKRNELHGQQAGQTLQEHTNASSSPLRSNESLKSPRGEDACMDQEDASAPRTGRETSYGVAASHNPELNNNSQQAQPHKSSKLTPTQFDSWHGPGIHAPDKVLYRGALVGPYGPAEPPGGFPVESFVCYPHPLPSNSEAVPRPGAGSGQYQSTSGDACRPQVLPNSYMFSSHPAIPAILGPFHTPVPYDGYYSYHQASFCTSGEQQMPSTRVATQPSFFKNPKSDSSITSDEYRNNLGGDVTQRAEVQVPSNRAHTPFQGPYKVLLKQQGDIANNGPQVKLHSGTLSPTSTQCHVEKPEESISKEIELSPGCQKNDSAHDMNLEIDHQPSLKVGVDGMGQPSNPVISNLEENSCRTYEGILKRDPTVAIRAIHVWKHNTASSKNTTLIEKIDGVNNKVRSAENHGIVGELPSKQERLKQPKVANARPEHSIKARSTAIPVSLEGNSLDMHTTDSTVVSRQSDSDLMPIEADSHVSKGFHSTPCWGDYHSNSMLDFQTDGGRTRELSEKDSSAVPTEKNITEDAYSDSLDLKNQRAKTKDLTSQRAKQLQREERMRDQKAKALTKLEELNRRSATSTKPKSNDASSSGHILHQPEDAGVDTASNVTLPAADMPLQANNEEYSNVGPVVSLPPNSVSRTPETVAQDSSASIPTLSMEHHTNTTAVAAQDSSQSNASSGSKHRQIGHRRRQKFSLEKNTGEKSMMRDNAGSKHLDEALHESKSNEKQFTSEKKESSQKFVEVNAPALSVDILLHNGDPSLHQKKKNNRNLRNKNKDDTLFGSSITIHSNEKIEECPIESLQTIPAPPGMETSSVPAIISADHSSGQESGDGIVNSQGSSKVVDEVQGRMSSHWRSHPSRKTARNYQSVRPTDKVRGGETVIWAPIRSANKIEQPEEIKQNSTMGNISDSSQQIGHDISGTKTKRAEMEIYVPKSVAKEPLQQEYNQKSSTHDNQMAFDDMPEKPHLDSKVVVSCKFDGSSDFGAETKKAEDMTEKPHLDSKVVGLCKFDGSSDFGAETKKAEENRPGRRGRVHASWRQRSSADSAFSSQTPNENVQPPDGTKIFNKPSTQHLPLPEQVRSDDREIGDNFMQKNSVAVHALTKDQGMRSKQKYHQTHRVAGSNYGISEDHNFKNETNDDSYLNLDTCENDVRNCINDTGKHAVGEHARSHSRWKPKSQISHQGKGTGGQRNFYHDVRVENFCYPGAGTNYPSNEGSNTLDQKDQSRNSAPPVEQMHIRKPVGDVNAQHESQVSPRRYGHLNGRFMHTSGKSNAQRIEDQWRSTPYFEYQPVDPYRKQSNMYHRSNSNTDQEPQGHHASRQRYKEHNHTQTRNPRRFGRGATTAHVDSNNGEE